MSKLESSKPLQSVLETVDDATNGETTNLKSILEAFGDRGFGPVLTMAGLFLMTPLGAIPGVPAALALVVITFCIQIVFGRTHPWLPKILARVQFQTSKIEKAKTSTGPWLEKIDGLVRPRLPWAANDAARLIAALICIILSISMVPLGMIPFGVAMPGALIGLFGLGIMARDGLVMLITFTLAAILLAFTSQLFP